MSNKNIKVSTGNRGDKVRSDCYVELTLTDNKCINIDIKSKVKTLYGKHIHQVATNVLNHFNIKCADLFIEDFGALDFVIAARIEAAIKKLISTEKEFLPPLFNQEIVSTTKDRSRVTRLYLPGNTPSLMINAGLHKPDGIILDLEDAVAYEKKNEAAYLVRNALRAINFHNAEKMVRINQFPAGLEDLKFVIPNGANLILIPKCEDESTIEKIEDEIKRLKTNHDINNNIWIMPIIESCLGVMNAYKIASCSENIAAIAIGLEDYTADLGVKRTNSGEESLFARQMVVNAAKAAGIQAIDSVFSDISDMKALSENAKQSKAIGFDGMGCIHPRQIPVINKSFEPDADEIDKAKKIVLAFEDAKAKGLGVISLGTKMIDAPVVKRALKIIKSNNIQ